MLGEGNSSSYFGKKKLGAIELKPKRKFYDYNANMIIEQKLNI